jgi:hypothetical protein
MRTNISYRQPQLLLLRFRYATERIQMYLSRVGELTNSLIANMIK